MSATTLPPDPEHMNDERAMWAACAIQVFVDRTRTDPEDALSDLLGDLMHWADRNNLSESFEDALDRARRHYEAETDAGVQS